MLDRKTGAQRTHDNIVTCTTVSFRVKRKQKEGPHGSVRFVSQAASFIKTTLLAPIEMSPRTWTDTGFAEQFVCTFN
jgi:hypothetical protein